MKKIIFIVFVFSCLITNAQVGIGTTNPHDDSILHIKSNNKGVLFPFVPLIETSLPNPLSQHVSGMMVYNYVERNDVTPGFYGNDGTKWIKMSSEPQTENVMSYVELTENLTLTDVDFVEVLELKFIAVKKSAAIDFSASGRGATNTSAGIRFRIENINTGKVVGTQTHMQDDSLFGTAVTWNASYSGILDNLQIGTEYTIKLTASVQKLYGTQAAYFRANIEEDHINLRILQIDKQ